MAFPALAAAVGAYAANNAMSEIHAGKQAEREMKMMEVQNAMNNSNVLGAYAQKAQGMKLAGLNPALASEGTASVASVSKGAAASGENVEFDPNSVLLQKQAENLDAQTQKTLAEADKIKGVDTENTIADTLFKNASTSERTQASERVRQLNEQYSEQNKFLEGFGKVLASKWQSSPWYNHLAADTKDTIDSIATGDTPLTVGGMDALNRAVAAQKDISDADRKLVQNSFDNVITEMMFNDDSVMKAITKEPEYKQKMLKANISKINAEIPKIRAEVSNLLSDLQTKKLTQEDFRSKIDAFKRNDLGYLKSKGEYGKWFEGYAEELLLRLLPLVSGGVAARGLASKSKESEPSMISKPGDKDFKSTISDINLHGVQSFKF